MPTRQPSDRRDGECQTKKSERPESCASDDRVIWRNAEVCQRIPKDERERAEAQCEGKPLQDLPPIVLRMRAAGRRTAALSFQNSTPPARYDRLRKFRM